MRMHLVRYCNVRIDVVRGKNMWRLTGITSASDENIFKTGFLEPFHRMAHLIEVLVRGEEPHPELFDFFVSVVRWAQDRALIGKDSVRPADAKALELFGVIHILDKLGYWSGEHLPEIPTDELLTVLLLKKKELVAEINQSLEATQIT
jgi:hypothetical protein